MKGLLTLKDIARVSVFIFLINIALSVFRLPKLDFGDNILGNSYKAFTEYSGSDRAYGFFSAEYGINNELTAYMLVDNCLYSTFSTRDDSWQLLDASTREYGFKKKMANDSISFLLYGSSFEKAELDKYHYDELILVNAVDLTPSMREYREGDSKRTISKSYTIFKRNINSLSANSN